MKTTISNLKKYAHDNELYFEADIADPTKEYVVTDVINPENNQNLIAALVEADDEPYHTASIQLTLTTKYHNWHDTVADEILKSIEDDGEVDKELIDAYNSHIVAFNQYGEAEFLNEDDSLDEIETKIINNNSKI